MKKGSMQNIEYRLMINGAPDDDGEADCKSLGAALA